MHWVIQNGIERRKNPCIRGWGRWNLCFFSAWLHRVLSHKLAAVIVLVQFSEACEQHHWTSYFKKSQSVRAVGSSYCLLLGDVESQVSNAFSIINKWLLHVPHTMREHLVEYRKRNRHQWPFIKEAWTKPRAEAPITPAIYCTVEPRVWHGIHRHLQFQIDFRWTNKHFAAM
jgi:hypothetical protein